ncbi:MAG: cysteine synthase A [Nannocystaceae bacterium]|nr:cysteine synthase A [Nannocystaceae bacterium]
MSRPAIADSILEFIGSTPLVRLRRLPSEGDAEIVVKLESFNPAGSVKDRVSLAMIEAAERDGRLREGDTIVEPTSGNTGIGLALAAAVKGYRLILTMPDNASGERRRLLEHYGAQVVLTPARKLMKGAIDRAKEIVASSPRCFMPQQFDNPANPQAHRDTTAKEILAATDGVIDALCVGVGTGGTITGVGQALRQALDQVLIVAVEPSQSRALSGGPIKTHAIEGIGAGFVPGVLDRDVIDEVITCDDAAAYATAVRLAREEGISAGMSGGAAVWAALKIAARLGAGKRVVSLIPDAWDRYATVQRPHDINGVDFII